MWIARYLFAGLAVAVAVGCGGGPKLKLAPVSGKVTLDGNPLPDGVIVFTKDGEIPREIKIVQAMYSGEAYVGQNHIQFAVYKSLGKSKGVGPGANEGQALANVLPGRYNQESKEFREVKDGLNEFHFDLQSK